MKKIPTLFERKFENHKVSGITDKVFPGMEWVLEGEGEATLKMDGACCAVINGKFYKRYDAKRGKKPPAGSIPCCEPDSVTGHWPHWVEVDWNNPADKWFCAAYDSSKTFLVDGATYEALGPHFQGNPYGYCSDFLYRHGIHRVDISRDFYSLREYLRMNGIEGIVFWKDGEPKCKIKRSDFGFEWPISGGKDIGVDIFLPCRRFIGD